jgi:hypothetical protein
VPAFFAAKVSTFESFAAFFVCLPFLGAIDSMVEWDRIDQHFLVLYSFLERGNKAKTLNSAPKSELTLDCGPRGPC